MTVSSIRRLTKHRRRHNTTIARSDYSISVVWEDPPPRQPYGKITHKSSVARKIILTLASRPGQWARVYESYSYHELRKFQSLLTHPHNLSLWTGRISTVHRKVGNNYILWAYYVRGR